MCDSFNSRILKFRGKPIISMVCVFLDFGRWNLHSLVSCIPCCMHWLVGFSCLQLEDIRLYLMSKFQQNRNSIMRVESELCPKIYKRLHREKAGSGRWLAYWAFNTKFEVKNGLQSFIVDLAKGVYSYRKWDITGIPCCHAVSCIFFNREQAEKYTNGCYHTSTYKACYEHIIDPLNDANMWTSTGLPPV